MDILTIEELQKICANVERKHRGNEWRVNLTEFLDGVQAADEQERSTSEFHHRLWEKNPVSAVGQGTINVSKSTSDPVFRSWVAKRSLEPVPKDEVAKLKYLTSFADEMLARLAKSIRVKPHLKVFRVMAAFYPTDFTTIAYRGAAVRRLARMMMLILC